jgi:HK97 family phage major capsid protein
MSNKIQNAAGTDYVGGGPVYLAEGTAETAPYPALLGRPVIPVEQCSTLGTVGDIILADLSQYMLADRGMRVSSSIHVEFASDQVCFRFVQRIAGQPTWKTPVTPKNGTDSLSPFVALATRA